MLDVAREGSVSEIRYLFPRPGSTVPVPKVSFVTRVGDQVCGVGYYADASEPTAANAAKPDADLAQLRRKLDAAIPAGLRPEWVAFLAALDQQREAEDTALAKARQSLQTAEAVLSGKASSVPDRY